MNNFVQFLKCWFRFNRDFAARNAAALIVLTTKPAHVLAYISLIGVMVVSIALASDQFSKVLSEWLKTYERLARIIKNWPKILKL